MFYIPFIPATNNESEVKKTIWLVAKQTSIGEYNKKSVVRCKSEDAAYKKMFKLQKKTNQAWIVIKKEEI